RLRIGGACPAAARGVAALGDGDRGGAEEEKRGGRGRGEEGVAEAGGSVLCACGDGVADGVVDDEDPDQGGRCGERETGDDPPVVEQAPLGGQGQQETGRDCGDGGRRHEVVGGPNQRRGARIGEGGGSVP